MRTPERRRSSSQGDATPRAPAHTLSHSPASGESPQTQGDHPTKRLGFFGDILLSSAGSISISSSAQRSSPIPHSFLPARTHSRGESALARDNASSPTPNMAASAGQPAKGHTSPSKASTTRTYDSKLVSREMHRLGTLAHLPSLALAPSLSATPSNIALASHMAPPSGAGPSAAAALAAESPWASLHVLILPLFNEEPLRVPIEDLNQLVRRHISTVVSAAPGKAVATLEHDTRDLISAGMVTLNSKLAGVSDENLVPRVVELWSSFWTQVLPYLEGALLPLQTDPILSSLYRLPKAQRPSSPTSAQNGKGIGGNVLLPSSASTQLGVRALALVSFRDRIVLPLFPRLNARLTLFKDEHPSSAEPHQPRLQQMLLVLVSQRSQRLVSLSLTAPPPQPTAGEAAITRLLRAMHAPLATLARGGQARPTTGAPSFLSAGLPRDRRGRIGARGSTATNATATGAELDARGRWRLREDVEEGEDEGTWGAGTVYADTPRGGVSFADPERERDKELLESLRSPDPEGGAGAGRAGMGGWGLGGEEDEYEYEYEDDDEFVEEPEENLDWDAAQSIVERMVGIKNDSLPPTPSAHQQQQPPPPPPHQQQPQQDPRRRMI
ncbi:HbrB-domain-containing protein [Trametes versicolor FP-101664 SS1]|uniref:HbrB-domain-containing protein n=1 Tax=Trametes versicolor (strain FP-101664) TaxID=717944 RepID=UPI0004623F0E|nr:HbrB-domain-containing protein [Trametes versicolor FP-101664 SS1]EIW62463.1 HbrB-domain-containing protein [Trametes versicolor FP-101664 SS1]